MTEDQQHNIQTQVDQAFVQQAEREIDDILLQQRRAFNLRWDQSPKVQKFKVFLRYFGLTMCFLGFVLCATVLVMGMTWDGQYWPLWTLLGLFLLLGWVFFKLHQFESGINRWKDRVSQNSCRKLAKKCVKQAAAMVPFTAQYEIKGHLVSYYRSRTQVDDDQTEWQFVWNRPMAGFACVAQHATVFFKSTKGFQPRIIILHGDPVNWMQVLSEQDIEIQDRFSS